MARAARADFIAFGRYQLLQRLGAGGMAEVWKARIAGPMEFSRLVAVKRILPHLSADPAFARMFAAEAGLLAKLTHRNIVQVFEFGEQDRTLFLVMELISGRHVGEVCEALRDDPRRLGLAAFVAHEVCVALAHVHELTDERGVPLRLVHRDVSPSNIMVGMDGAVKLLDFGIAKVLAGATETTETGAPKGKARYLAPERFTGVAFDHRVDIYATGAVLYEALVGRSSFVAARELGGVLPPPSHFNALVPEALDHICLRALAPDPQDRYPSCAEMAQELAVVVDALGWGSQKISSTMHSVFADVESRSASEDDPTRTTTGGAVPANEPTRGTRSSTRLVLGALLGAALLGGAAWWAVANRLARTVETTQIVPSQKPGPALSPTLLPPEVSPAITPRTQPDALPEAAASEPPPSRSPGKPTRSRPPRAPSKKRVPATDVVGGAIANPFTN